MLAPHALAHGLSDRERPIQVQFHNLSFMVKKQNPTNRTNTPTILKLYCTRTFGSTHTHTYILYLMLGSGQRKQWAIQMRNSHADFVKEKKKNEGRREKEPQSNGKVHGGAGGGQANKLNLKGECQELTYVCMCKFI